MKKTTFNSIPTTEQINKDIERIKNQIPSYKTKDVLISILNLIDLTSLNTSDTVDKIRNMTLKINDFNKTFPNFKNVAAICVYPIFVQLVKETLLVKNVKIAAVGASFPASQTFLSIKAAECELIIHKGADEVDIVLSVGSFLEKNYLKVAQEIEIIKNILENFLIKQDLTEEENLELDFLKNHILNSIKFYTTNKNYNKDILNSLWNENNNIKFLNKLSNIIKNKLKWIDRKIKLINSKINDIKYDETSTYYGELKDYKYIEFFEFIRKNLNDCTQYDYI